MRKRRRQIEAVLFDLGGTLIKTAEIPQVLKRILEGRGIARSLEEITDARTEAEKGLDFRDLAVLLDEFWVQWNLRILSKIGISSDRHALAEYIAAHWWDYCDVSLYPDVEEVLSELKKRGLKMGIITNGLHSDVKQILSKVDLQKLFDVVVVIDTLRKMKPDAEVFLYAIQELRTNPSNALFVGDEIENDYRGAERAGLASYLIDRNNRVQDTSLNRISSLKDLLEIIR